MYVNVPMTMIGIHGRKIKIMYQQQNVVDNRINFTLGGN